LPPPDLVSVVIPAYNAAETVDETLRSVRAQTHSALEILVVDDGSTDSTPAIIERHCAADARVRLIRQANGGVARARNRAIAEAAAELLAMVDADDLWAPTKIEAQLAALRRAGPDTVLVYTWYAQIDSRSRITSLAYRPVEEGRVLRRMLRGNLVGNASAPLIRRDAVLAVGGYDPRLRDLNAEGCEDVLLYFRLAERGGFALVPEHLTGYRQTTTNMSSDAARMIRSWELVVAEMRSRYPEHAEDLREGRRLFHLWLLKRALRARSFRNAALVGSELLRADPLGAAACLLERAGCDRARATRRFLGRCRRRLAGIAPAAPPARFEIGEVPDA
jgi:glycosyltransferase involved in cell wall biosynthesis